jgi:NADH-quinone oxidoreductase subunit N
MFNSKIIFFLFLPEFFIVISLLCLLLFLTIITKRRPELVTYNVLEFCWFFCLLFVIFYFFLVLFTPASYYLLFGVYSTHLIFFVKLFLSFCFIVYLLYLWTELRNFIFYSYEFLIVLVFSLVTLNLLLSSYSFVNIFIFLEIFGLCVYYLVASQRNLRSLEASVKYFIFGSISSIFLAFGFFLIYFSTGIINIIDLDLFAYNNVGLSRNLIYQLGCFIVVLSIIAKIGGGFFFYWVIDVYDGVSYPLLIFLNLFAKLVYIITLFNLMSSFNSPLITFFVKILIIFSLLFGSFGALYQTKIKRFLIYTSIYNISLFSIPF